jgi:hypothetical protein
VVLEQVVVIDADPEVGDGARSKPAVVGGRSRPTRGAVVNRDHAATRGHDRRARKLPNDDTTDQGVTGAGKHGQPRRADRSVAQARPSEADA